MRTLLITLFYIQSAIFGGQLPKVSSGAILATAESDYIINSKQQTINFLRDHSFHAPLLREIEFRTGTGEFRFDQQEYALRFSANAPALIRSQKEIYQISLNIHQAEKSLLLKQALKERYNALITYFHLERLLKSKGLLSEIYKDKQEVLLQSLESGINVKVSDLAQAEEEYNNNRLSIIALEHRRGQNGQKIKAFLNTRDSVEITFDNFITIKTIGRIRGRIGRPQSRQIPSLQVRSLQKELAEAQYKKQKARAKKVFNFLQTEYEGNKNQVAVNNFSIRLGLNIPLGQFSKSKINKAELGRIESTNNYEIRKTIINEQITASLADLDALMEQHLFLLEMRQNTPVRRLLSDPAILSLLDPGEILELKEAEMNNEILGIELEYKILKSYVEWLDISDTMISLPLKNYLSSGLESL